MTERIGIIAGNKNLPIVFSQEAKKNNIDLVAVCIKQDTSTLIKKYANKCYWINVWELSKLFEIFKNENLKKIVMIGQITPSYLFKYHNRFDERLKSLLNKIRDKRADTIFSAIADELKLEGLELVDSTIYLKDIMPKRGVLSKREPNQREQKDINLGFQAAKHLGGFDIGQTVVIKNGVILAVEAFEGTDSTIARGGFLGQGGAVVVKTSKPKQDMRFDVPLVGLVTIKKLIKAKASCLAIEAEKTLVLDKKDCVKLADKNNISLLVV